MPWYKFNVHSFNMKIWDSLFALVILFNIIWAPLAIAFQQYFYNVGDDIDWDALDLTINGLWGLAFFINLNRVDLTRHIYDLEQTAGAYLRSPFLIPDLVSLVGSVAFILSNEPITGKYFELIRLLHFRKTLFPINLSINSCISSGQKRVSQIQQLIFIFFFFIMLAHLCTCLWIYMGFLDRDEPPEQR